MRVTRLLLMLAGLGSLGMALAQTTGLSVRSYGAKGDGIADDTTSVQAAITDAVQGGQSRIVHFPAGRYRITSPLNLTNHWGGGVLLRGEGNGIENFGTTILAETGGVAIDLTGSQWIRVEDLAVVSGARNPSTVGILMARSADHTYAQLNSFRKIRISLVSRPEVNGGLGTIGVYNFASELFDVASSYFEADTPVVITDRNIAPVFSQYTTIAAGKWPTSAYQFRMTTFDSKNGHALLLRGVMAATFDEAYLVRQSGGQPFAIKIDGDPEVGSGALRMKIGVEGFPRVAKVTTEVVGLEVSTYCQSDGGPAIQLDDIGERRVGLRHSDVAVHPGNMVAHEIISGSGNVHLSGTTVKLAATQSLKIAGQSATANANTFVCESVKPVLSLPANHTSITISPGGFSAAPGGNVPVRVSVPAASNASCITGSIASSPDYLYVCDRANHWIRFRRDMLPW